MTPADLVAFIDRAWPIVVVVVPATWGAAKLYYDREIRLLERRIDAAKSEDRTPHLSFLRETVSESAATVAKESATPKRGALTLEGVLKLQKEARAILKAIRHVQEQLKKELPEPGDGSRIRNLRIDYALARARSAYARIADDVMDMRDQLLAHASPKGRVERHFQADAQYTATLTAESLALIESDLSLLCVSVYPEDGFG